MVKIYQFDSCPFCRKVREAAKGMGLLLGKDYELVEASRGTPGRDEVLQIGGKGQVPFLVDGEVNMYESDDIIRYLQAKFKTR
ncbi:MAG: glutathione S-transferase N-terminal domain-containing protein [Spirochaetota bacterium]